MHLTTGYRSIARGFHRRSKNVAKVQGAYLDATLLEASRFT